MELEEQFLRACPGGTFLQNDLSGIERYLSKSGWFHTNEKVLSVEKPGEGNMNFVVRVKTNERQFIVKQSRPYVEKYPQIEAPIERIASEAAINHHMSLFPELQSYSPKVYHYDSTNYVLVLEDLGEGSDYSFLYKDGQSLTSPELRILIDYLGALHNIKVNHSQLSPNMAMRRLNHEHIFRFPFDPDNGFDLDDIQHGLSELSIPTKTDSQLKGKIEALGKIYLDQSDQRSLLHGDYYPGSWLKVPSGIKVIDPEFGYVGRAEFDVGVFLAHLLMTQHDQSTIDDVIHQYRHRSYFDKGMMKGFAGTEILRRLLGVAQLPLKLTIDKKDGLIALGRSLILES